ncbi:helix-turn-helix domain-containing protein [Dyadobacter fermentans]|uniref:Transcriptional regulator, AraC family n=1 Tax=Dyadobacter fermentans (strain ATCC 700827 / DSM 18053 / CIP 107007 / KCTC 52180 / NS114) TaxID=471854 RepID=C6W159_DYAFD|nr:AraC family transcriptional regulator [Dyadobacter fermentans]ACT91916.1 transcriptional regulator, AraC family [Dyadobacter fermentans DSM 18053]
MQILPAATYLGDSLTTRRANGILTSVTSYSEVNLPNVSLHAHENAHVTTLLAGATLEKRQRSECYRQAGQAVFFHAGEPHQNSNTLPGSRNFNIEFTTDFFQTYHLDPSDIAGAVSNNPLAALVFVNAYRESLHNDPMANDSVAMAILSLLDTRTNAGNRPPKWVGQVTELLHDRWNEQVGLEELSKETGVHSVTISKHFRRYFACSLSEYMRKLKVLNALSLIKNTSNQLTHIAYEAGFADQSHFTRVFKEVTGFLPKQYRNV